MTVLSILSWDPANAAADVANGHSVKVNFKSENSSELEKLYDTDPEFDAGTHSDTQASAGELELAPTSLVEDVEGETVGTFPSFITLLGGTDGTDGQWRVRTGKYVETVQWDKSLTGEFNDAAAPAGPDIDIYLDIYFEDSGGLVGPCTRLTGSGSSLRGYWMSVATGTGSTISLRRLTGEFTYSSLASWDPGFAIVAGTWYRCRLKSEGNDHRFKFWDRSNSEPASWLGSETDATHTTGVAGVKARSTPSNETQRFDNAVAAALPLVYPGSGNWISDNIDISSVGRYSTSLVTWDETQTANTTITVEVRYNGGTWQACTNGSPLPGLTYDDDLTLEAQNDMDFRVTLTTSDTSETPTVENLRAFFDPCDFDQVEIEVDGLSATPSNGKVAAWGKQQVSGGSPVLGYDDLYAQTQMLQWIASDDESITATFKYTGVTIGSITFDAEELKFFQSNPTRFYFLLPLQVVEANPAHFSWTAWGNWAVIGHDYSWIVIDKGIAIHADGKFYVGNRMMQTTPASFIVGLQVMQTTPASLLVQGSKRQTTPASILVQGHMLQTTPASFLVGIRKLQSTPASFLVGIRKLQTTPASFLVFSVNRNNVLEIHVIDETTYQALLDEGVVFN